MARQSGKGPATPPAATRKAAKDVISQAVEASAAKVADLGDSVQKSPPLKGDDAQPGKRDAAAKATRKLPPAGRPAGPDDSKSRPVEQIAEAESGQVSGTVVDSAKPVFPNEPVRPVAVAEPPTPEPEAAETTVAPVAAMPEAEGPVLRVEAVEAAIPEPVQISAPPAPPIDGPSTVAKVATPPIERVASVEPGPTSQTVATPIRPEPMPAMAAYPSQSVRESMEAVADGLTALNCKMIQAFRTNAGMSLDLIRSLIGVTSVAEAVLIHTQHARHRFEVMSEQARELQALARKVTTETAAPLRRGFGQAVGGE